jgi:hypothetical protein
MYTNVFYELAACLIIAVRLGIYLNTNDNLEVLDNFPAFGGLT